MCKCTVTFFQVTDIYVLSEPHTMPQFEVLAICHDCHEAIPVARHTMPLDGDIGLFREHHEITQEFYKGLK